MRSGDTANRKALGPPKGSPERPRIPQSPAHLDRCVGHPEVGADADGQKQVENGRLDPEVGRGWRGGSAGCSPAVPEDPVPWTVTQGAHL